MNRCVQVVSAGSDLPQKYWSEAHNRAQGHVRKSGGEPVRGPGKPRKAIVSLQIIAIRSNGLKVILAIVLRHFATAN